MRPPSVLGIFPMKLTFHPSTPLPSPSLRPPCGRGSRNQVVAGVCAQTVVIDIENTLVTLIDIKKKHELEQIKSNENFENDYIIMKK